MNNNNTNNDNNNTTMMTTVNIEELKKLFDFTKYGSKVRFFRMIGEKQRDGENYDTWINRCNRMYFDDVRAKDNLMRCKRSKKACLIRSCFKELCMIKV